MSFNQQIPSPGTFSTNVFWTLHLWRDWLWGVTEKKGQRHLW